MNKNPIKPRNFMNQNKLASGKIKKQSIAFLLDNLNNF